MKIQRVNDRFDKIYIQQIDERYLNAPESSAVASIVNVFFFLKGHVIIIHDLY